MTPEEQKRFDWIKEVYGDWEEHAFMIKQVEKLQADNENLKQFIVKTAKDHIDLCRQLGTHHPIPNVGCFGVVECVNCFKIGFVVYKHGRDRIERLEKFIKEMAENYGVTEAFMKGLKE